MRHSPFMELPASMMNNWEYSMQTQTMNDDAGYSSGYADVKGIKM